MGDLDKLSGENCIERQKAVTPAPTMAPTAAPMLPTAAPMPLEEFFEWHQQSLEAVRKQLEEISGKFAVQFADQKKGTAKPLDAIEGRLGTIEQELKNIT